ncbi:amino acid ABC transporter permease [Allopusillimonas ginsengisoli]|uniref:amino acid ABC transporter permease n=1 Tax=Allopusillimonas ginsengisoli TaxID=453575 RepID=UPI0014317847|nr:amino acid ABC transporter permease [Allopusillimonas ginsengisoli]
MRAFEWLDMASLVLALRWTVLLSVIGILGGGTLGLIVALGRTSSGRMLRIVCLLYIRIFQSTPLLMQLFLVYFGISILGVSVDPLTAAALALSLNAAAFLGEIWRGCIESVPRGQDEAAQALALRSWQRVFLIVLPQAVRIAIPPTVVYLVQLIKNTSLASIIGFVELTRTGQIINNATFQPFLVFSLVALLYFVLCWPISRYSRKLELRFAK